MRSFPGRMLSVIFVAWGLSAIAAAAPPPPQQLAQWVRDLDAERYAVRETASRRLAAAGDAAIDVLAAAAEKGSPESAWRASAILEQIALEGSETTLLRVTAALEQLSRNKPRLATTVGELRARQTKMRRDRAAVRIRSLGGKLTGGGDEFGMITVGGPVFGFFGGAPAVVEIAADLARIDGVPLEEIEVEVVRGDRGERAVEEEVAPGDDEPEPAPALPPAEPPAPPPAAPPPVAIPVPAIDALAPPPPADLPPLPPVDVEGDMPPERVAEFEEALDAALGAAVEGPIIGAIADAFVGDDPFAGGLEFADGAWAMFMHEVLVLDSAWRGGDLGLAELADIPSIVNLSIQDAKVTDAALDQVAKLPRLADLSVRGSDITADGLRRFREKRPETRIYASGDAMLGINASRDGPCVLTGVYDPSGAFDAGLRAGDEILSVGGHKTRDFSDLTIAVFRCTPGQKLAVEYKRGGTVKTVDVLLKDRAILEARR
jgi:hypothetical protein